MPAHCVDDMLPTKQPSNTTLFTHANMQSQKHEAITRKLLQNTVTTIHYHQSELVGDVAVPVSVRQAVLFWALRSPDVRPRLNWSRSSSTVLSQVCLGRPGRRLQFLGAVNKRKSAWYHSFIQLHKQRFPQSSHHHRHLLNLSVSTFIAEHILIHEH